MNLLCPNCQKPLTVPEQYAGQPMRCPLCAGTFTVPALPSSAAPPPPPPPPPAPAETYGFKDPVAPPPPPPAPNLNIESGPAVKPPSPLTGAPPPPPPSGPSPTYTDEQPTFPSTPTPEGYSRKYTIWFSPKVLHYVPAAALFLILVLSFFAWTGVFPGGVADAWQNAWQACYGGYSLDSDAASVVPPFPKDAGPGWSPLLIFYLLLFIPTFVITVGCLALQFMGPAKLPPALYPILPWRWGVVAALNLVLFLFLVLQLVFGFSLENTVIAEADKDVAAQAAKRQDPATTPQQRSDAIARGLARQEVSRTIWLDLVVLLHILAIAAAGLMFWLNRRGGRPAPRVDLLW